MYPEYAMTLINKKNIGAHMHPTVNQLIQLQELALVREEHRVAAGPDHFEQINAAISSMIDKLPADVRVKFEKMHKRDQNVIVPVSVQNCSGCGIQLPRSLVQQVRKAEELQSCPNCARFLYTPVAAARNTRKRAGRFDAPKPGISRFSAESLMHVDMDVSSAGDVINAIGLQMEHEGFVDKSDLLIEEALRREALYTTAVDHGLAFPHVRGVEGGALTLSVGLIKDGIRFDGPETPLTHIVFFMMIPTSASAFYLKLLAGLTETFMNEDAREALLASKTQTEMWKTLIKVTRKFIK
jgi:mannitol/fructose-specific phosphotransferase system IIA component (Ntr-type)